MRVDIDGGIASYVGAAGVGAAEGAGSEAARAAAIEGAAIMGVVVSNTGLLTLEEKMMARVLSPRLASPLKLDIISIL